jgi:amino acid transporter
VLTFLALFLFSHFIGLRNTTSKSTAAVAACLTILSYVATAVVSGNEAIEYAAQLWSHMPIAVGTILLLAVFAGLNLMGISDSAAVALAIFVTHLTTLFLLIVCCVVYICQNGFGQLSTNYHNPHQPILWRSIIYGFSSAMLGVSGFESSANFVEEQKAGVFTRTLRNMWVCVCFFNPCIAFMALCIMDQDDIRHNQSTVLAQMGQISAGTWLNKLVSVDAFLVLSGGVLTSFVGVTGLCRRLALDRCLPQFLLAENEWRHTNHWIILGFFGVCSSMYLMLNGDVVSLSNVYSVSFMSVMGLFALGNMLLKYKRGNLKREVSAPWWSVFAALGLVLLSIGGLLAKDASILVVFCLYFLITGGLMATMFFRVQTLKILYSASKAIVGSRRPRWLATIADSIKGIGGQSIGFFAKSGRLSVLNKAILYVRNNEDCAWIRIIHVYEDEARIPAKLLRNVHILDECYPKIKIDLVLVPGIFSPDVIDYLSQQLKIPKNLMFITCPREDFSLKIETLGGVRLITH